LLPRFQSRGADPTARRLTARSSSGPIRRALRHHADHAGLRARHHVPTVAARPAHDRDLSPKAAHPALAPPFRVFRHHATRGRGPSIRRAFPRRASHTLRVHHHVPTAASPHDDGRNPAPRGRHRRTTCVAPLCAMTACAIRRACPLHPIHGASPGPHDRPNVPMAADRIPASHILWPSLGHLRVARPCDVPRDRAGRPCLPDPDHATPGYPNRVRRPSLCVRLHVPREVARIPVQCHPSPTAAPRDARSCRVPARHAGRPSNAAGCREERLSLAPAPRAAPVPSSPSCRGGRVAPVAVDRSPGGRNCPLQVQPRPSKLAGG
jgi:hypothetical protein